MDLTREIKEKTLKQWIEEYPVIQSIIAQKETFWRNEKKQPYAQAIANAELSAADVDDASKRLGRFAAYFKAVFPETRVTDGLIESPLRAIPKMKRALEREFGLEIPNELLIKLDSHLAVSGSIKARGGIY